MNFKTDFLHLEYFCEHIAFDNTGAWTPKIQNAYEWLQIDLGRQYIVTKLHTQGRRGSDEYVSEFFLEYSDDGRTWRQYTNRFGIAEVQSFAFSTKN